MTTIIDWTPYFEDADALIAPYSQGSYFVFACAYLLYYDYFLTIEAEVRLMWSRSFSLATAMFLYIRYASLLQVALDVLANVSITSTSKIQLTDDSCEVMKYLTTGVACANFMVVSAFVALRLTALYSRNWYLGGILFILGLLNPVFLEGVDEPTLFLSVV